ncbi:MAG TPA: hypothetical protein VMN39_02585 [Longimicrobiaceae bacterium]|nr:hypothetical protein [Longimicrobiaceae bacterium]
MGAEEAPGAKLLHGAGAVHEKPPTLLLRFSPHVRHSGPATLRSDEHLPRGLRGLRGLLHRRAKCTATLYAPAGGVSGRTTAAIVVWLIAWAILHARWKGRDTVPAWGGIATWTLIALGFLGTFPPVWELF